MQHTSVLCRVWSNGNGLSRKCNGKFFRNFSSKILSLMGRLIRSLGHISESIVNLFRWCRHPFPLVGSPMNHYQNCPVVFYYIQLKTLLIQFLQIQKVIFNVQNFDLNFKNYLRNCVHISRSNNTKFWMKFYSKITKDVD
jgi:hypothetical protein